MKIDPTIFRSYDIRGIVGQDLTVDAVRLIGRAYATQAQDKGVRKITVGRDCRESSPRLYEALVEGLTKGGLDVLNVGVVATPMQYFSIPHFSADGGIQITGSHNPPEYNGLKISIAGETLYGDGIQALREIVEAGRFSEGSGSVEDVDVITPYTDYCVNNIHLGAKKPKVVVDAGNGTAGPFIGPILERLGIEHVLLYCDMDATFPNHHPDPTVEANLEDLKKAVRAHGADVGIAFDGDGDRLGAVDENGKVLWGDQLMILFARSVLEEMPGASIVGEVKCSKTLYDDIAKHGGKPIMWKTGHSLIKKKMKELDAALAGEMSGHIFFKHRYFGFDDGTYSGLRLLELLSHEERPLSRLLDDVPKTYSTPEIRRDCPEALKFELVDAAIAHFKKSHDVIDVDGARVNFPDGWGLVRASNTQPLLVLRFEAQTEARLEEIKSYIEGELELLEVKLLAQSLR